MFGWLINFIIIIIVIVIIIVIIIIIIIITWAITGWAIVMAFCPSPVRPSVGASVRSLSFSNNFVS